MQLFFSWIERLKNYTILQVFTIYLRYLIGGAFVFASIVKVMGERFTSISIEHPIGFFFEAMYRTGFYWQFIGWAQLIGGLLLMTQVFATLGALIYFILMLNIFLITYSLNFTGTPFVTFLMLLGTIYLLVWDWQRLLPILTEQKVEIQNTDYQSNTFIKHPLWAVLGLVIFLTTLGFQVLSFGNVITWFLVCLGEGLLGLLIYFTGFELFKTKKGRFNIEANK